MGLIPGPGTRRYVTPAIPAGNVVKLIGAVVRRLEKNVRLWKIFSELTAGCQAVAHRKPSRRKSVGDYVNSAVCSDRTLGVYVFNIWKRAYA